MVALGISLMGEDLQRRRRHELEAAFARHMVRCDDAMMRAMALQMVPGLQDAHVEALRAAAAAADADAADADDADATAAVAPDATDADAADAADAAPSDVASNGAASDGAASDAAVYAY